MLGSTNTLARRHAQQLAQRGRHRREHGNLTLDQGEHRFTLRNGVLAEGAGEAVKEGTGLSAPLHAQKVLLTNIDSRLASAGLVAKTRVPCLTRREAGKACLWRVQGGAAPLKEQNVV
jgi:hypothetical protein